MVQLTQEQLLAVGAVVMLWLTAATSMLATGLRSRRLAHRVTMQSHELTALASISPALVIIIPRDDVIELSQRLSDWLGLERRATRLTDLEQGERGLSSNDLAGLTADVNRARTAGSSFTRLVRPQGGQRVLRLEGGAAPSAVAEGGILIWVFDATANEAEIARLRHDSRQAVHAFETLSQLIEAAPVPMWHRGPDLRLTLVNRAYVEAVDGINAEDVIERGLELIDAGDNPINSAAQARKTNALRSQVVPATIGGQRRSMRFVDVPLGAAGVAGYAIDNDELDRARRAFRRFVDAQRDTLDRLSAGVAQFAADRSLTFSNQPFVTMFGLRPEWLVDAPEFERVLDRMRESGRIPDAGNFPEWKAERRRWFTATDGAIEESWLLPGGAHLRVVAQPLPDSGLLVIFEDRTEQVQLASARDTLLRVRNATFDHLYEAIGVIAGDGRIQIWNRRFRDVWALDEDLLRTRPRVDALAPLVAPMLARPRRADLIRELVRGATTERRSRSGRVAFADGRSFVFSAVPLPDGNALFTMLDVTDSRRMERVLRERAKALELAGRVKTAFVANLSYELRTPLTAIAGYAEMLAKGYAGSLGGQADDYVAAIRIAVGKLTLQVDEVLKVTQDGDEAAEELTP